MLNEKLEGRLAAQLVAVLSKDIKRSRLGRNYLYFVANRIQERLTPDEIAYETLVTPFQTPKQHKLWHTGNIEEHLRVGIRTKPKSRHGLFSIDQGYLPKDFGYSSTQELQGYVEAYFRNIGIPQFSDGQTPVMAKSSSN